MEEKHIPGADNSEPDAPAPEEVTPEDEAPEDDAPEGDKPETGEEEPPEDKKPEDEAKSDPEPKLPKKRSIYDDYKDEKKERKAAETRAAELEAENARLKGEKPAEPAKPKPADDLEAYAQDHELDAKELARLADAIAKRTPRSELSEEDKQALTDLKAWRQQQARAAEDAEILATTPTVQTELGVTDAGELKKVMDEVVRLSHTPEFHDKEVEYIVWKNKAALSKLVSPKKASFEQGGQKGEAEPEGETDFSANKGITPEMAGKAATKRSSPLEVRRGSKVL